MSTTHASTAAAERRKADRERKRRERAARKAEGRPTTAMVHHALVEALSFGLTTAPLKEWRRGEGWQPINLSTVIVTAVDILQHCFQIKRPLAAEAIKAALKRRPEHDDPMHVPTCRPRKPPAPDSSDPRSANAPVTPSGPVLPHDM